MSKKTREEIKKLQSMKASIEAELESLNVQENDLRRNINSKKITLKAINQRIDMLTKDSEVLTVSEHAIIRYIERVLGINIDEVVEKILPSKEVELIKELGNGRYPIQNGEFKVVVRNGVVVTVHKD